MNFTQAMTLCFQNPPGKPGCVMVARDNGNVRVYLGGTNFKGEPKSLTQTHDDKGIERFAYSPRLEDILADDWVIFKVAD